MMRIERAMSNEEKEEYSPLHEQTAQVLFVNKCDTYAQAFVKEHKPFCRKCALEEFNMHKQNLFNELKLRHNRDFAESEKPFADLVTNFDLSKYGKPEYFDLVGVERKSMRRREGGDVWYELVINKNYACKPYSHGCTISIAKSDMNDAELAEENKCGEERKRKMGIMEGVPSAEPAARLPIGTKTQAPIMTSIN